MIKLNLGCGDKILEGYINVDVVESRAGKSPDIICELSDLKIFPNDYADEVMAIHVVEHFWRWEIENVLKEWIRVLKPGGKMILECPNLISVCKNILKFDKEKDFDRLDGPFGIGQIFGIGESFGHKYSYTPNTLSKHLESAGFRNLIVSDGSIEVERDFCIKCFKP